MPYRQLPNQADRLISHILVGLAAALVVGSMTGLIGFIVAGLFTAGLHAQLDAPLARLIAVIG